MTTEIETNESAYPWTDLDRAFDAVVRRQVFGAFGVPMATNDNGSGYLRTARTDIEETPAAYRLRLEVPGIPKEKLAITVRGNEVEVRGEFTSQSETNEPDCLHRERTYAGYYRALALPEPVLADKATATVVDGVLTLELPKERPEPTPTEVKVPVQ